MLQNLKTLDYYSQNLTAASAEKKLSHHCSVNGLFCLTWYSCYTLLKIKRSWCRSIFSTIQSLWVRCLVWQGRILWPKVHHLVLVILKAEATFSSGGLTGAESSSNPAFQLPLTWDLPTDGQLDMSGPGCLGPSIGKLQHRSWFLSKSKTVVGREKIPGVNATFLSNWIWLGWECSSVQTFS